MLNRTIPRVLSCLLASALAATLLGCGSSGPQRAIVTGRVTYRGQPVKEGQIRFFAIQGTKAPMNGAEIRDGLYTVDAKGGVVVGTHRVEIEGYRPDPRFRELAESLPPDATELERPPPLQYIPEKYNRKSELTIRVEPGSSEITEDFNLTD